VFCRELRSVKALPRALEALPRAWGLGKAAGSDSDYICEHQMICSFKTSQNIVDSFHSIRLLSTSSRSFFRMNSCEKSPQKFKCVTGRIKSLVMKKRKKHYVQGRSSFVARYGHTLISQKILPPYILCTIDMLWKMSQPADRGRKTVASGLLRRSRGLAY
jgi:hypothetical protein